MRKRALMHGFMLTACLAYGQAPPSKSEPPDFTGVMEGTVFRSDGTPLRNVSVTALPQSNSAKSMNALTDSDGKFTIKDVEPGRYKLEATRANFVRRCYGQLNVRDPCVTLTVGPRQHLELLDIRMQPSAVIAGRIVDDHDEAVVGARVAALRWGYLNGHKDLLVAGLSVTDDRGQYRVHQLLPGNYYLAATLAAPGASATTMQTVASLVRCGEGLVVCSPSYYPSGSPDLAAAQQVQAAAGDELLNINFRMITTGGVRLSGTVRSPYSNVVGRNTAVRLIAKLQTTFGDAMDATTDGEGSFEFKNMLPGLYLLTASYSEAGTQWFARLDVQVGNVEVNRLTLSLQPVSEVSGEVRLEGAEIDRVMQPLPSLRLQLEPQDGFMKTLTAEMSSTHFVFRDVREGDYVLRFSRLPADSYVSSVRVGGRELADKSIAVRGWVDRVEVILGNDPGQIEGSVIDAHDQPYPGARVVLIPNEPRRKRLESYKSVTTDQYGNFQFKSVMPGSYKLFAWDSVEKGAWEDPEFLSTYEALGVPVEATPKTRATQSVRMIAQTASR